MMVSAEYSKTACQQLLRGKPLTPLDQPIQPASSSSVAGLPQLEQQQEARGSSADPAASEADIQLETPADPVPQQADVVCKEGCNWLASLVCEVQPPAEQQPGTPGASGATDRADVVLNAATVAVCTSWKQSQSGSSTGSSAEVSSRSGILSLGGAFCGAALPGKAGGVLGQQRFLLDIQGTGAAAAYASTGTQPAAAAAPAAAASSSSAMATAAAAPEAGRQLHRRISIRDTDVDAKARAAMAVLVSAWHELLVGFTGAGQQLYGLMPDLLAAVQAGDTAAAYAFKQVSSMIHRAMATNSQHASMAKPCQGRSSPPLFCRLAEGSTCVPSLKATYRRPVSLSTKCINNVISHTACTAHAADVPQRRHQANLGAAGRCFGPHPGGCLHAT